MSNRAWMPLHIDDYIRDTDHLSATEHGAYLLLIMKYWRDGGLPSDETLIRRYAKLSAEQWAESRAVIAALFDDGWRHRRIDAELEKAADIIEKRKAAGRSTQFKGKTPASAGQKPEHVQSKSTAPLTSNLEKKEPKGSSKKRATRLSENWSAPDDWIEEAVSAGMTRSLALSEAERMKNWSLGSKNGAKLDWRATWRNWFKGKLDNRTAPRGQSPPGKPLTVGQMFQQEARNAGLMDEPGSEKSGRVEAGDGSGQALGAGGSRLVTIEGDFRRSG